MQIKKSANIARRLADMVCIYVFDSWFRKSRLIQFNLAPRLERPCRRFV